jgi:hypothetical protein
VVLRKEREKVNQKSKGRKSYKIDTSFHSFHSIGTMKGHLTLVLLNKYGGVEETMGYPYLLIENGSVYIYSAVDDLEHLGQTLNLRKLVTIHGTIPEKHLQSLYFNFNRGFGSNFAYNYASYDAFVKGATEYINHIIQ